MTHPKPIFVAALLFAAAASPAGLTGCKKRDTDNPDVAAGHRNGKYSGDIVTGNYREETEDQGKGIHPSTLRSIEDTIGNTYERDFERCLEDEMDEAGTRFMRSMFTVEFRIDTKGDAGSAKILDIWLKKQNAKGTDIGEVPADKLKACVIGAIDEWVFDPAPEVDYVHTYRGQVGEAF
ncbi:MAG: hypothetical protein IAG13_21735 [Deltaproteobacteria bacterium]|nr:hypothetical protein [Nannocystaceae bacterium]